MAGRKTAIRQSVTRNIVTRKFGRTADGVARRIHPWRIETGKVQGPRLVHFMAVRAGDIGISWIRYVYGVRPPCKMRLVLPGVVAVVLGRSQRRS